MSLNTENLYDPREDSGTIYQPSRNFWTPEPPSRSSPINISPISSDTTRGLKHIRTSRSPSFERSRLSACTVPQAPVKRVSFTNVNRNSSFVPTQLYSGSMDMQENQPSSSTISEECQRLKSDFCSNCWTSTLCVCQLKDPSSNGTPKESTSQATLPPRS